MIQLKFSGKCLLVIYVTFGSHGPFSLMIYLSNMVMCHGYVILSFGTAALPIFKASTNRGFPYYPTLTPF